MYGETRSPPAARRRGGVMASKRPIRDAITEYTGKRLDELFDIKRDRDRLRRWLRRWERTAVETVGEEDGKGTACGYCSAMLALRDEARAALRGDQPPTRKRGE